MSRPRAATLVATSSLARPLRKRSITPSRRPWGMSPCSGTASKPRAPSWATSSSTVILRRRNTIAAAGRSRSRIGAQHVELAVRLDVDDDLVDRLDGQRRGLHLHVHGLVEVAVGELADRRRHRGREEQRLAARRRLLEDPLDVLHEAEREHLVGLVEHDVARVRELQPAAADQVHHAAGRADHDLRALAQLHGLLGDRLAAEDGDDPDALELRERAQCLRNLDAELARGRQHEHLDVLGRRVDLLDGRQPEGRRLAAAGLCLADDVAAAHDHRDGLDLNRHGLAVFERLDRFEHALREAEFGESGHLSSSVVHVSPRRGGRIGRERRSSSWGLHRGARHTFPLPQG